MTIRPARMYNIAPMKLVARASQAARTQQSRQRLRDKTHKQPRTDVLNGKWRKKFDSKKRKGRPPAVTLWDAVQRYCETLQKTKKEVRYRGLRNGYLRALDFFGRDTLVHNVSMRVAAPISEVMV